MSEHPASAEEQPLSPIERREWSGDFWRATSATSNKEASGGVARSWSEDVVYVNPENGFFALCDGMGGRTGGMHAATIAAHALDGRPDYPELYEEARDAARQGFIRRQFNAARGQIIAEQTGELGEMNTTATVVYVGRLEDGERYAVIGHIGDCRAYLVAATGEVHLLTEDDDYLSTPEALREVFRGTPPEELGAQRAAIREELERATDVGQLSVRSLGLWIHRNMTHGVASEGVQPHITAVRFPQGSRLVIMSDGVYENLTPSKLGGILTLNTVLNPEQQADMLVREAQKGTKEGVMITRKRDDKSALVITSQ